METVRNDTKQERLQLLNILREIAKTLNSAWSLDSTLDLITKKTAEILNMDSCSIYLLEPDEKTLRLRASTGLSERALGRATLRVGHGMTGYAVSENKPVYASDAQTDPHFEWVDRTAENIFHSLLAVPLVSAHDHPIGAMNIQSKAEHQFSTYEIALLQLIADLAAGALARAQVLDQQQKQLDEMQTLAKVSEVMTSPQYLDDMLNIVTEMAAKTMDASVCSLFLINEAGTHIEMRSAKRTNARYKQRQPYPLGVGIIGKVAQTGQLMYSADVRVDPDYFATELAVEEGLVSLLSVPLTVRDRVIGVLNCYTAVQRAFSAKQQQLFTTLANQTALAIENAQLVTNTAVLREMHHRIKNNLQTIAMLMELQINDADRLTTQQALEINIHRIRSIATVHEVLSERGFKLVDVKDVLARIAAYTVRGMVAPGQEVTIDVFGESLPLPSKPATGLTIVVNELIQNALEHGFAGENGRIEVSLGKSKEEIIILVRDNGAGFTEDYQPGLGLEIVQTVVRDDLEGQFKINPVHPRGAEVSIRLPRRIENLDGLSA